MGNEDRGKSEFVVDLAQRSAKLASDLGVERSERLVEEEDARLASKRSGERDPLALAARELMGIAAAEAGKLHQLEQLVDPGADIALRRPSNGPMTSSPKAMFRSTVMCPNNA